MDYKPVDPKKYISEGEYEKLSKEPSQKVPEYIDSEEGNEYVSEGEYEKLSDKLTQDLPDVLCYGEMETGNEYVSEGEYEKLLYPKSSLRWIKPLEKVAEKTEVDIEKMSDDQLKEVLKESDPEQTKELLTKLDPDRVKKLIS